MTSKYGLSFTIDPSTGINPGINNRAYCPGQVIKGTVALNVYQSLKVDQIQVSLVGSGVTTYFPIGGLRQKKLKEHHTFLQQFRPILPSKPNRVPYRFVAGHIEHFSYEFMIPEFSTCETCRRVERLPPSMGSVYKLRYDELLAAASITYQVKVVVELKTNGTSIFQEKFVLLPLATTYNTVNRPHVCGMVSFESDIYDPVSAVRRKSLLRLILSSSSGGSYKAYNMQLGVWVRPQEHYVKIVRGRNVTIPPTSFIFEYRGSLITDPVLGRTLGQFVIKSLKLTAKHGCIMTSCAGHTTQVLSEVPFYENKTLNIPFDIGREFHYNPQTNIYLKEMLLYGDIVRHFIHIPLESYQADFPPHCNQISRRPGGLEYDLGMLHVHSSILNSATIFVPFEFRGVENEYQPPSDLNIQAPAGPPPGYHSRFQSQLATTH